MRGNIMAMRVTATLPDHTLIYIPHASASRLVCKINQMHGKHDGEECVIWITCCADQCKIKLANRESCWWQRLMALPQSNILHHVTCSYPVCSSWIPCLFLDYSVWARRVCSGQNYSGLAYLASLRVMALDKLRPITANDCGLFTKHSWWQ